MRSFSALLVLLSALAGCSSEDQDAQFEYGRDDMRSAIEGSWEGTATLGAADEPMKMTLVYSAPDARPLCGNRVLSVGAGSLAPRCVDVSSIHVTGVLNARLGDADARDVAVRGTFEVASLRFDGRGALDAEVDGRRLEAALAGDVLEGSVGAPDGSSSLPFTLRRAPR